MLFLKSKQENEDYNEETEAIENDAIIECMLVEIEILEMRLQSLIMQNQKKLRLLNKSRSFYDHYKIAYMESEINEVRASGSKWINKLEIVK